ncbi:MAG: PepSY domain-containing protein, partial [Anaerotignum sp.]|nr:PepSY domain-containing protein [Anaerotignum sp.]
LPSADLKESELDGDKYTMEFTSIDKTFQYEVDAVTGKVLQVIDPESGIISCACCSDPDCTCMVDGKEVCSNPYCTAEPMQQEETE